MFCKGLFTLANLAVNRGWMVQCGIKRIFSTSILCAHKLKSLALRWVWLQAFREVNKTFDYLAQRIYCAHTRCNFGKASLAKESISLLIDDLLRKTGMNRNGGDHRLIYKPELCKSQRGAAQCNSGRLFRFALRFASKIFAVSVWIMKTLRFKRGTVSYLHY